MKVLKIAAISIILLFFSNISILANEGLSIRVSGLCYREFEYTEPVLTGKTQTIHLRIDNNESWGDYRTYGVEPSYIDADIDDQEANYDDAEQPVEDEKLPKEGVNHRYFFGLNMWIWLAIGIVSIFLIVGAVIYSRNRNYQVGKPVKPKISRLSSVMRNEQNWLTVAELPTDISSHKTILEQARQIVSLQNELQEIKKIVEKPFTPIEKREPKIDILSELKKTIVNNFNDIVLLTEKFELHGVLVKQNNTMTTDIEITEWDKNSVLAAVKKDSTGDTIYIFPVRTEVNIQEFNKNVFQQLFNINLGSDTSSVVIEGVNTPAILVKETKALNTYSMLNIGKLQFNEKLAYLDALNALNMHLKKGNIDRKSFAQRFNLVCIAAKENYASIADDSQVALFKEHQGTYRFAALKSLNHKDIIYVFPLLEEITRNDFYSSGFHYLFNKQFKEDSIKASVIDIQAPAILVMSKDFPGFYEIKSPGEMRLKPL